MVGVVFTGFGFAKFILPDGGADLTGLDDNPAAAPFPNFIPLGFNDEGDLPGLDDNPAPAPFPNCIPLGFVKPAELGADRTGALL